MEHLWRQGGAADRNRTQVAAYVEHRKSLQIAASACQPLRLRTHGKEGVDGSSPSEGSAEALQNRAFSLESSLHILQLDADMEHFMEVPGSERPSEPFTRPPLVPETDPPIGDSSRRALRREDARRGQHCFSTTCSALEDRLDADRLRCDVDQLLEQFAVTLDLDEVEPAVDKEVVEPFGFAGDDDVWLVCGAALRDAVDE